MTPPAETETKKIFVFRCLHAVSLSVAIQFLLLTVFLLFINFDIFHLTSWIFGTFSLLFSFYTWFCITPLIGAIILYGIFIGNSYLSLPKYYPSRFSWLCATSLKKLSSIFIHGAVGFLTAWLYSRFLSEDYRNLLFECFDGYCLNSRYMFLALSGVYSGLFYLFKEGLVVDLEIKFPVIQELKYVQIRSSVYAILYTSLLKSFIPTICFSLIYWAFGWILSTWIAINFLGVGYDENSDSLLTILSNLRLVFYSWILSSQILSNMYIMDIFFTVLLTEEIEFSIEKNVIVNTHEITIVEALSLSKVPLAQHLACLNLFNLANSKCATRRLQIFALSVPGGHPYNWNQLSGQCLSIINSFTDELANSVKEISTVKTSQYYTRLKPTATETAEKILLRQHNESYGIRNMMPQIDRCKPLQSNVSVSSTTINDTFAEFSKSVDIFCKTIFRSIPGLYYLFGEPDGAKTADLLAKSRDIIWITQGLAGLCSFSLQEDKYGVVQSELPTILKTLLKLKLELDKLNNVNLNGKKVNRNYIALKYAVKRSLYRICTVFAGYIQDLIDDPNEIRHFQCFINYQEW